MKKLLIIFLTCMSTLAFAKTIRKADLPAAVNQSFYAAYPMATHVNWDREGYYYEASYKLDGRNMLAIYNAKGELLEADTELKWEEFPTEVQHSIIELGGNKFYYWYKTENKNRETLYGCWYKRDHRHFSALLSHRGYLEELRDLD